MTAPELFSAIGRFFGRIEEWLVHLYGTTPAYFSLPIALAVICFMLAGLWFAIELTQRFAKEIQRFLTRVMGWKP